MNVQTKMLKGKEIWEVVILGTSGGAKRIEFTLTEELESAKKVAEKYKMKLNNCQEVVIAKLALIDNEYQEVFGRIVFSKRNNKIIASDDYLKLVK